MDSFLLCSFPSLFSELEHFRHVPLEDVPSVGAKENIPGAFASWGMFRRFAVSRGVDFVARDMAGDSALRGAATPRKMFFGARAWKSFSYIQETYTCKRPTPVRVYI